jgi:hypothetical protein
MVLAAAVLAMEALVTPGLPVAPPVVDHRAMGLAAHRLPAMVAMAAPEDLPAAAAMAVVRMYSAVMEVPAAAASVMVRPAVTGLRVAHKSQAMDPVEAAQATVRVVVIPADPVAEARAIAPVPVVHQAVVAQAHQERPAMDLVERRLPVMVTMAAPEDLPAAAAMAVVRMYSAGAAALAAVPSAMAQAVAAMARQAEPS